MHNSQWITFSTQSLSLLSNSLQVFHSSSNWWFFTEVSGSNSPRVSRILPSILADFIVLRSGWSQFFLWSPVLQYFFLIFEDHFKDTNYNWYDHHLHVPQVFQLSGKIQFIYLFVFFYFPSVVCRNGNIH